LVSEEEEIIGNGMVPWHSVQQRLIMPEEWKTVPQRLIYI
jgi:hypothetical protein